MRCRTSLSQAKGSTLLSFAVAMTEQTVAHRTPPRAGTLPGFQDGMAIGQHGSWNRSRPSGYKVVFALFANGRPAGPPRDILTGFLAPDERISMIALALGAPPFPAPSFSLRQ
jgi:glucose/arabinose dehydrogenase